MKNLQTPNWLYRGYTGHEHLKEFDLINMNGRMYDPVLARFLSPDKLLQNPSNTQNYNGYSYVLNNPLKYTDPSGWAYGGYQFLSLTQGFNLETASNGGEAWDPNGAMGYLVDGVACTKFEYLEAERAGGIVHPKGISSFFKVTQADGTVVNTADAGEAASLFNEGNNEHKVIFENGKFNYYDVMHVTPDRNDNNLTASIDGGGIASTDPQDGGPTENEGGFIIGKENFEKFMYDKAENSPVEVSAMEVTNRDTKEKSYFVFPWADNKVKQSENDISLIDQKIYEINANYHTHPTSSGPSRDDALASQQWNGLPIYTMGANGNMYIAQWHPDLRVPYWGTQSSYGSLIRGTRIN